MKLIVGLGNPGADYEGTRHNVGFELVDRLASAHGITLDERIKGVRALVGRGRIAEEPVLLVKPLTYMNVSGEAVLALAKRELVEKGEENTERLAVENILVICDDIHLPVGKVRLRAQGSSGGQNGLKSVASQLATQNFARVRIGVGEPPPDSQIEWVLGRFGRADRLVIDDVLIIAMGAVEVWTAHGIERAMNRFNSAN
ncbi:MAG: aminoacyl-tRNA hydrolase [Akkermansiaceae bacterium]|nr:aminoacyl-tRNA hydrolase [Armatimonadota bacterium]